MSITAEQLGNRIWRLNNLYYITDAKGEKVKFKPNKAQQALLDNMHTQNIILKSRQLGFSTLIQLLILDACLFNSNVEAGVIADTLKNAKKIFKTKIKFPYDNLPDVLKDRIQIVNDSAEEFSFNNGSTISIGTGMRSGTLQLLHVSELGKICAKSPDKANEIKTGALNTVQAGNLIFIESTAEGKEGDFFDYCEKAKALMQSGTPLTDLDMKFHFFSWWQDPTNVLYEDVFISSDYEKYFTSLVSKVREELNIDLVLTQEQKAWYVKKDEQQGEYMKREYPGTPNEAFEQAIEGAYFAKEMALARKQERILRIHPHPSYKLNTFWDIGMSDLMTIWFHQRIGGNDVFLHYYENSGEGLAHYVNYIDSWCKENNVIQDSHYLPHDGSKRDQITADKFVDKAQELLTGEVYLVKRVSAKRDAVQAVRDRFNSVYIDDLECKQGIKCLDNYKKEWNDALGCWREKPLHNWASHGVDGFMTFATGYHPEWDEEDTTIQDYNDAEERNSVTGY